MVLAKGSELKIARIRAGLFQFEVAEKSGVAPNTYAQIELGKRSTSGKTARAICSVLDADFDKVFKIMEAE